MSSTIKATHQDHGDCYSWQPPLRHFTVVGVGGIVEHHGGIGLTVEAVVGHLCRESWPKAYEGVDLLIYVGARAVAMVSYAQKGSDVDRWRGFPRAVWLWTDDVGREAMGRPVNWRGGDDGDDDEVEAEAN